jgi:hypothetical protein
MTSSACAVDGRCFRRSAKRRAFASSPPRVPVIVAISASQAAIPNAAIEGQIFDTRAA